jgi:hypothetical protein
MLVCAVLGDVWVRVDYSFLGKRLILYMLIYDMIVWAGKGQYEELQ